MPHDPSEICDRHGHLPVEHRLGYIECERCKYRCIRRLVLPNGAPTQDDLDWLHHRA